MKADLRSKLTILSSSLLFFILQPLSAAAQGNCAMEQHVVDSWTATVQADQDAIQKQSQGSRGLKLDESESLNERLERDTKRMQQAQTRLAECQKKASNSPSPAAGTQQHSVASARPISLSRTTEAQWKIDGLGTLTLGQADPQSRTIAGVLLVQTDSLQGIPKDTKLTMKGPMHVTGFKLQGSKLTKGNYLNIVKKKEDIAYEYRLTLEAQLKDPKTAAQLNGTATLMKFERYIADKKGTRLGSFAVSGPYTPGDLGSCEMPVAEAEVFDPSNPATSQKYLDQYHHALAQTNGKAVLSDTDVIGSAKALLPFLRYAAAHQDTASVPATPVQQQNPSLAYVTGLLGPSSLVALRTQLQATANIARVGGIAAETAGATAEGVTVAEGLAETGIIIGEIPGGQLVALGVLGIAAIAEGVHLWEKAHSPSITTTSENCREFYAVRLQAQGAGVERSVPLAGPAPITVAEGLAGLAALKAQLTGRQLEERADCFRRAERFIRNAAAGGGVGPPGQSFALPGSAIRVDVEILRGINFPR
ncbi:MAG TPA: hypothetical protein VG759_29400 [Candidatus Angelobacter sp.]|jgi:hypothetical protein|nr:hypothetical protein [Candidatus Angelobacter sp.]